MHLGFIRWPGLWEIWLPDVDRAEMPDYCYGPETLSRFCEETGIDLPVDDAVAARALIAENHRAAWRDWKCAATTRAVARIRAAVTAIKPDVKIAINTLPFFVDDFDDAVDEVFAQSVAQLTDVSDVFEVMAYHQILRRDAAWPGAIGSDVKRRSGGATTVCTVQGSALYLDGMHAGRGRAETITTDEFIRSVDGVEASDADGLCVFTFTDFLNMRDTDDGRRRIARLQAFRR